LGQLGFPWLEGLSERGFPEEMNGSFASAMALSANLFLRQNQSLVMTPQLMQSIQLLQMTHFELVQFIGQEVEKNPLLEFPSNDAEMGNDRDPQDEPHGHQGDDSDEPGEALSGDWYDNGGEGSAGRLSEELDANYANVFPDDGAPERADAGRQRRELRSR
jgi:RNA polymerase sigma-54 factor